MSTILLLGEGDFSFTASLLKLEKRKKNWTKLIGLKDISEKKIISSSLDSRDQVLAKYPNFADFTFPVLHNVNAIDVKTYATLSPLVVIWNHPHLGFEDAQAHIQLMRHFFHTISFCVEQIVLSFIPGQFERWEVEAAGSKFGFKLAKKRPFVETDFPGYISRRNLSGTSFRGTHWGSYFYIFVPERLFEGYEEEVIAQPDIYSCKECGKKIRTAQGLQRHLTHVHLNGLEVQKPILKAELSVSPEKRHCTSFLENVCLICEAVAGADHMSKFGLTESQTFSCEICQKVFREKRALDQHITMKHNMV